MSIKIDINKNGKQFKVVDEPVAERLTIALLIESLKEAKTKSNAVLTELVEAETLPPKELPINESAHGSGTDDEDSPHSTTSKKAKVSEPME